MGIFSSDRDALATPHTQARRTWSISQNSQCRTRDGTRALEHLGVPHTRHPRTELDFTAPSAPMFLSTACTESLCTSHLSEGVVWSP